MTLEEINSKFVYKTDKEQFGVEELWTGLQETDGKLVGDCEDYAITLKKEINFFNNWNYFFCKLDGIGHCVLISSDGSLVIDNNCKTVLGIELYTSRYNITDIKKYNKIQVFFKFFKAYILTRIK